MVMTTVVITPMRIDCFVTQYHVHQLNSDAEITDVFRTRGFVMAIEIAHKEKMNQLMLVEQEIGVVQQQCLNVILVVVLTRISFVMAVSVFYTYSLAHNKSLLAQ